MDFEQPPANPIAQLTIWIEDARKAGFPNPNAMALATVDPKGQPSIRIVLLKSLDARGAVLYRGGHFFSSAEFVSHRDAVWKFAYFRRFHRNVGAVFSRDGHYELSIC